VQPGGVVAPGAFTTLTLAGASSFRGYLVYCDADVYSGAVVPCAFGAPSTGYPICGGVGHSDNGLKDAVRLPLRPPDGAARVTLRGYVLVRQRSREGAGTSVKMRSSSACSSATKAPVTQAPSTTEATRALRRSMARAALCW
jgi:hypothetical protein